MNLSAYLFAVSGTVIVAAIVTAIAPEGKISGVVKTAVKLVCVIVIAEPIAKCFVSAAKGENPTFSDKNFFEESVITADEDFIKYCSELRIAEAEKAIETEISKKYDSAAKVSLEWQTEEDGRIKICRILVKLPKATDEKTRENLRVYLEELYGAKAEIITAKE